MDIKTIHQYYKMFIGIILLVSAVTLLDKVVNVAVMKNNAIEIYPLNMTQQKAIVSADGAWTQVDHLKYGDGVVPHESVVTCRLWETGVKSTFQCRIDKVERK